MKKYLIVFMTIFCLILSADEVEISEKIRVAFCHDGDTFVTLSERYAVFRIWGIDAPELEQNWGETSKAALNALIEKRHITFEKKGMSFNRTVAIVKRGNIDVGLELIKMGLAWHDARYAPDNEDYAAAMADAKENKRGLWSDSKPVAPWTFRENKKTKMEENDQ